MAYHTDLRSVFRAFDGRQREFTWLITNVECIALNDFPMPDLFRRRARSPRLVTVEELSAIIDTADLQFAWGVFSGFKPSSAPDSARLEVEPFADGNEALWSATPRGTKRLQHPGAEVELVCWDSSADIAPEPGRRPDAPLQGSLSRGGGLGRVQCGASVIRSSVASWRLTSVEADEHIKEAATPLWLLVLAA